jgi:hypothetical protein
VDNRCGLPLYSKREKESEFEVISPSSFSNTDKRTARVLLQPGQVVEVLRRVHFWVKIRVAAPLLSDTGEFLDRIHSAVATTEETQAPVVGWVELFTHIPSASPPAPSSDPSLPGNKASESNYDYVANLIPLKDLEFARHGQARPVMSSCGHAIHADCWDTFMASNLSSHINARSYNRHSIVNPVIGEVGGECALL